jgi:hypothetical protein
MTDLNDTIDLDTVDVPQGADPLIIKHKQLIPNDDGRKLMRALKMLDSRHIQVVMRCIDCDVDGRMPIIEATRAEETNELLLVCGCTLRIMEGIR